MKIRMFKNFRKLKHPFALFFFIVMSVYVVSIILPAAWVIITTFKDRLEFRANRFGWPRPGEFTLENYMNVFSKMYVPLIKDGRIVNVYVPQLMFNGVVYSVATTAAMLFVQMIVAYGCAKYRSKVGSFLYSFAIVTMILPIVGSLGAQLLLFKTLGFYDNFFGILLGHAGWGGTTFLLFHASFKGISNEYREAAFIDGASHARVMFLIMIPMIKPTIIALFILNFMGYWNDYMTPMIYLPSMPTIAYGLFQFRYSSDSLVSAIPMQITGCVIVMMPIIILFVAFRNKIMGNLALGGIKG